MSSSPPSNGSPGGQSPRGNFPRPSLAPSLARTSLSTTATARTLSTHSHYSVQGWEQSPGLSSDIRGDLAAGWGDGGGADDGIFRSSRPSSSSAARVEQNDNGNNNNNVGDNDEWGWRLQNKAVHPIPLFYPMDARNTRRVSLCKLGEEETTTTTSFDTSKMDEEEEDAQQQQHSIEEISMRISTACQSLSIQGLWDNASASATLCSMERVEMEVNMYLGDATESSPPQLLVELQRRKGCSVTFHNYRKCLLDAAEGKFDPQAYNQTDGLDKPFGRDRCNQPRASLGRPSLSSGRPSSISRPSGIMRPMAALSPPSSPERSSSLRAPSFSADDAGVAIAGLKTEGEGTASSSSESHGDTVDKALKALNMAASLIRKDRVDARRLGMESLVLLTDPLRAGMETAKIASRVVLLGTASDDVAMDHGDEDVDVLFDESSGLGIRENILEMIMADDCEEEKLESGSDTDGFRGIEKEFTDSLFNLCLTVLSNALHTIEESIKPLTNDDGSVVDDDRKPSPKNSPSPNRRRAATEPAPLSKRFIDDTNNTFGCDVLSSLIRILGQAKLNPHDAYHSARCLGVLFKGCGNSHKARARKDLDAKRIIAAALEVGSRSHAKLADASRVAMMALVTDDEDSIDEEGQGGGGRTQMEEQEEEQQSPRQQLHQPPAISELPLVPESMSGESDLSR